MVGPMASELTGIKLAQLVSNDYEVPAAASDALASTRLIGGAVDLGYAGSEIIAVIEAIQARSHDASVAGGRD